MFSFLSYFNAFTNTHIFELLPKNSFFQKIKVSISVINVTLKLNWSGVDKIFKNKSCKMSNAVKTKVGLNSLKGEVVSSNLKIQKS